VTGQFKGLELPGMLSPNLSAKVQQRRALPPAHRDRSLLLGYIAAAGGLFGRIAVTGYGGVPPLPRANTIVTE
jgi:hypothetical protein